MPTTTPARPDANSLAERPATPGAIFESFVTTSALGIVGVSGVTALVTALAGPLPFAFSTGGVIARTVIYTGLACCALAVGEKKMRWTLRAPRPPVGQRRHPATWATLVLAAIVVTGALRGGRPESGEFQRAAEAQVPLGVAEARARANPDDPMAQFAIGVAYARAERFAEADAPLQRAAELAPRAGIVHEWYAWTRSRLGDARQAAAEYRVALANHDRRASAEEGLARSLIPSGGAREAELMARRHLESNANDATWQGLLGWSLMSQRGRTDEAIRALETALVYNRESAWLEVLLGYAYRSKADFKSATTHFERAFKLHPTPQIGYELGATRLLACDPLGADSAFAATEKLFPHMLGEVPPGYREMRATAAAARDGRRDPDCGVFSYPADPRRAASSTR